MLEGVCVHARASKYIHVRIVWLQVKMAQVNQIGAGKNGTGKNDTGKTSTGNKRTSNNHTIWQITMEWHIFNIKVWSGKLEIYNCIESLSWCGI